MNKIDKLPPFKRFCVTIGNLPSSYVDSMSYYECLMWLCKYLKDTVVPAVNENAEAVNELINWFNNLDVQDEIDNKLDEMVESGQLQEIISEYLNSTAIFGYDTVEDMKEASNLINGSFARTMGYYSKNDGGSSLYKIRTVTNEDEVDGMLIIAMDDDSLVAEKILLDTMLNVLELGIEKNTDESTKLQDLIDRGYTNLYFPTGTYKFSITLDEHKFHLKGDGLQRTYIKQVSSNTSPININITEGNFNYNSIIEGFEIEGNDDSTANGLNLTGAGVLTQCSIKDVACVKFKNGFYSELNFYTNIIENCHFSDSTDNGFVQSGSRFFNNNNFISCKFNSNINFALDLFAPTGRGFDNIFTCCDFEKNTTPRDSLTPSKNYSINLSGGLMNTKFSSCYFEYNGKENDNYNATILLYNETANELLITVDSCSFTYEKACISLRNNTKALHINNIEKYSLGSSYIHGSNGVNEFIGGSYEHDNSSNSTAVIVDNSRVSSMWREANQTVTVKVPDKKGFVRFYAYNGEYTQIIDLVVTSSTMKVFTNTASTPSAVNYSPSYNSETGTITFTNSGSWGNTVVYEVN